MHRSAKGGALGRPFGGESYLTRTGVPRGPTVMDIEIVSKNDNALLKRKDVAFKVSHPKEKTPQRAVIRDKLAGIVGTPREGVIITRMRSHFGTSTTEGSAKCYGSADDAKKTEPQFLLKRHGLVEKKEEKKEEGKAAPPPPPPPKKEAAPAAKPAEKKEEKPYVPKGAEKK